MMMMMMMVAGVRLNLLSLQPALRTLTSDYNCLKRQVQDFPFMLEKAISEAKQEVGSPLNNQSDDDACSDGSAVCQICQVINEVSSTNQELLRKYKREMNLRKKCHNELVRLKGWSPAFPLSRASSCCSRLSQSVRTLEVT